MANIDPIIIQVKLVMSEEDKELLGLLKELRGSFKPAIEIPVNIREELKKLQSVSINTDFHPTPEFVKAAQETFPKWLKNLLESPGIEHATQFNPQHTIPESIHLWNDEEGPRPRDMSYGYIVTQAGRVHVHAKDWIVTKKSGDILVCSNSGIFRVPVGRTEG